MNQSLTLLSSHAGCAAKIGPDELKDIIGNLKVKDTASSKSLQQFEDAGTIRISETLQIAQSIDVITPVSDVPTIYGGIAVAHALNDLYAKGAKPISGLLTLGIPLLQIQIPTAHEILQGAIDKLEEAGAIFLGGHTLSSPQLELGVAVTGLVQDKWIANNTCEEGDILILTKPLGSGIITTALKLQNANLSLDHFSNAMIKEAENTMLELSDIASATMIEIGVNACTDISGFGLMGHLCQMISPRSLTAILNLESVPIMDGVLDLAKQMIWPANCERNSAHWWDHCLFSEGIKLYHRMVLFDPQTSGGLLISVDAANAKNVVANLHKQGMKHAAEIGRIIKFQGTHILIQ